MKIRYSHINRESVLSLGKDMVQIPPIPRGSLTPFSQLDILWVLLALKVFGIGAVISYGIAVLMKITMACISATTKEKEVQK